MLKNRKRYQRENDQIHTNTSKRKEKRVTKHETKNNKFQKNHFLSNCNNFVIFTNGYVIFLKNKWLFSKH